MHPILVMRPNRDSGGLSWNPQSGLMGPSNSHLGCLCTRPSRTQVDRPPERLPPSAEPTGVLSYVYVTVCDIISLMRNETDLPAEQNLIANLSHY